MIPFLALFLLFAAAPSQATRSVRPPVPMVASAAAETLYTRALRRLASSDPAQRRFALDELEDAFARAPRDPRVALETGRANLEFGRLSRAMDCFESASRLAPDDVEPLIGLAEAARREWLFDSDSASFGRALRALQTATERAPLRAEAWRDLAPLLYEAGELRGAGLAAERARALAPDDATAELETAYLHYRAGHLAVASERFEEALPRLSPELHDRIESLEPLLSEESLDRYALMKGAERADFERAFWRANDPDPTTPLNEARLEYRARVAHVALLTRLGSHWTWDMRSDLYARYGPPQQLTSMLGSDHQPNQRPASGVDPLGGQRALSIPASFPSRSMTWDRPDLGISVVLEDVAMRKWFRHPIYSPDARPSDAAMARVDLLAAEGGKAVFSTLPPGARPLDVAGAVHRFPGESGPRLFAFVAAAGSPADTMRAECVVLDSTDREVARAERRLSPSACDPATRRGAEFGFDLPPGDYRVAMAVSDGHGGRGVLRRREALRVDGEPLAVSDVVVVCRLPAAPPASGVVALDPDPQARTRGSAPLAVYFEIHGLSPDGDGVSHCEISYSAVPASQAERPSLAQRLFRGGKRDFVSVRSRDNVPGRVRRQFLTVPVRDLPSGDYRLEVRVRDLRTGAIRTRTALFHKDAA